MLKTILLLAFQLVVGMVLAVIITLALGAGNGWELLTIATGASLGVWGVGILTARWLAAEHPRPAASLLIGAVLGSLAGVAVILAIRVVGFAGGFFLPTAGAALGYHLLRRFGPRATLA